MLRIEAVPNPPLRKSRNLGALQRKVLLTFSAELSWAWRRIEQRIGKITLGHQAVASDRINGTIAQPREAVCASQSLIAGSLCAATEPRFPAPDESRSAGA
ncbi:hypothetical protein IPV08_08045 [Methylobacterium sp. SD274]|uniref:hypothetical protein n=1 Tax=Methylobacterium sp. SD274 TaxID=2782009 RepID=UPI001A968BB3|nr:hypothetical protein [Methylobacterium sp. SD274]MBO1019914.1 hypothetical protein [Methylobacterium sp. SD274]